jgi:hypothetical protein
MSNIQIWCNRMCMAFAMEVPLLLLTYNTEGSLTTGFTIEEWSPKFCSHYVRMVHIQGLTVYINPLTPELNPSAQRCLTRFLLVILFLERCSSLILA